MSVSIKIKQTSFANFRLADPLRPIADAIGSLSKDPPVREPELDAKTKAARAKIKETLADGLNEEHRQAAAQDRLGNPVTRPDGKIYNHEQDVAENRSGLSRVLRALRKKINHEDRYGRPRPEARAESDQSGS